MIKLDIGSGIRPMVGEEWETLDVRPVIKSINGKIYHPDIVVNILNGIPCSDNHYDYVRLSSVLEHFNKIENKQIIKECYRVLKPDGKIWISVPNMLEIAEQLIKGEKIYQMMNFIYGEQNYEGNLHKWGYTNISLKNLLSEIGFKNIEQLPKKQYSVELIMEGVK